MDSAVALPTTKSARTCGRRMSARIHVHRRCSRRAALPLITPSRRIAPLGAAAAGGGAPAAGGGSRSRPPTTGSESAGARRTLLGSLSRQPSPHGALRRAGLAAALRLLPAACRACRSAARRGVSDALLAAATARMNSRCDRWPSPLVSYCAKSARRLVLLDRSSRVSALASAGAEPARADRRSRRAAY